MSIERCFLTNQVFDFLLLAAVARGLGRFKLTRVMLAASLTALYALPAHSFGWVRAPVTQLVLLIPLTALTVGQWRFEPCLVAGLALIASAAVSVFFARFPMLSAGHPILNGLICVSSGAAFTTALLIRRRRFHAVEWLSVYISAEGRQVRLRALLDTGNRLSEPLTGEPVLIADHALIHDLMPCNAERVVAYGGVGGGGILKCFRPEALTVSDGTRHESVQAWVAVYPGRLPGGVQALAPATLAIY